ncbi:MAG TPA: DUF2089 family protein [Edaphocola sp.]|nr:DUF2089 family protein [Edaphocola sp.]
MKKTLPYCCPACGSEMQVRSLGCPRCDTLVSGSFRLPELLRLSPDDQQFIVDFVKCSGSLKIMAQQLKLSYPTVRNLLDDIISRIKENENKK